MGYSSILKCVLVCVSAIVLLAGRCGVAAADESGPRSGGHRGPVYQRHAFESPPNGGRGYTGEAMNVSHHFASPNNSAPQINSGWFQRPYPYHLDYYRMRYGGSYAPYFGNLYGPPQVVTAPPYYGPYYGGYGFQGDAFQGAYGAYGGVPMCPCATNDGEKKEEQKGSSGVVE